MRKSTVRACVAGTVVLIGIGTGCGKQPPIPGPTVLFGEGEAGGGAGRPSPTIKAKVYIDATKSMYGFVNFGPGAATAYSNLLQGLLDGFETGWRERNVTYLRVGATVEPVTSVSKPNGSSRSRLLDAALQPAFYTTGQISLDTRLDLTLADGNSQGLTVIISDLFQQGQAVSELVSAARATVFARGNSVGLLGVRSRFKGEVCDVLPPPSNRCFAYSAQDSDAVSGRPIYILAFGPQADVTQLLQTLSTTLQQRGVSGVETFLVPRHVGQILLNQPKRQKLTALVADNRALPRQMSNLAQGFLVRSASGSVPIRSEGGYAFVPEPLIPDLDFAKSLTRARLAGGGRNGAIPAGDFRLAGSSLKQLSATEVEWTASANVLADRPGDWRAIEFRVLLPADAAPTGAIRLPAWIEAWDLPAADVSRAANGDSSGSTWTRTLRLKELATGLCRAAAMQNPEIEVARVFYYLRIE